MCAAYAHVANEMITESSMHTVQMKGGVKMLVLENSLRCLTMLETVLVMTYGKLNDNFEGLTWLQEHVMKMQSCHAYT